MEVRASSITEIAAQSDRLWGDDDISHFQSPGGVCGLESPLLSFMGEGAEEQQGPSYRQELIHTVISNASFFLQSGTCPSLSARHPLIQLHLHLVLLRHRQ
jgi:hypothetical protein